LKVENFHTTSTFQKVEFSPCTSTFLKVAKSSTFDNTGYLTGFIMYITEIIIINGPNTGDKQNENHFIPSFGMGWVGQCLVMAMI